MKLVVGLGNPGRKYQGTRHNVGFEVAAELARRYGTDKPRAKFQGEVVQASVAGEKVTLLCPATYMNLSGASVLAARDFFKIDHEDILIVCDDIHLPLAKLRIRTKGSSGGQKGLGDVIRRLGGGELARLRIGVGSTPEGWDAAGHVLGKFGKQERVEVEEAVFRAADAVVVWIRHGIADCMNQYN
jgi:peptidyl-tRNA hydrolase, PTH1 family